jgi:hypothetical protein
MKLYVLIQSPPSFIEIKLALKETIEVIWYS